jgi:hypothetical protein
MTVPLFVGSPVCDPSRMKFTSTFAFRPLLSLSAIWPPLLLAVLAGVIGLFSPFIGLKIAAVIGVFLLITDTIARHRQFEELRLALRRTGGLTGHALARFRKARTAWCSRRAALAATVAEGFGRESRELVHSWGYRPWHIFPDGAFSTRSPFLRLEFWKSVLGLSRS